MTYSSGASVTLTVDSSSPSYQVSSAGTTGVTIGVIRLRASNEALNLTKLGFTVTNGAYGTTSTGSGNAATGAGDLSQTTSLYLYNSAGTLLGTATFIGNATTATSTLLSPFSVARDTDTLVTVKADLAGIGVSSAGGIGNLVKVDPLNFEGTGASSGTTIRGGASGTLTGGVRLFKSYPTFALDSLPSTGAADGRLMHFKVTSNSKGPISVSKFTFTLATTTATVTNIQLYGFNNSDYATNPISSGGGTGGQVGSTLSVGSTTINFIPTSPVQVNGTVYFELKGSVSAPANSSVVTGLSGDATVSHGTIVTFNVAAAPSLMGTSSLVWSGNSTSTSILYDVDWSNGFTIPGLPSGGLFMTRSN